MAYTADWFTPNIANWLAWLGPLSHRPHMNFLEVGAFEGMASGWLMRNVVTASTSTLTCCDTWSGPIQAFEGTGEEAELRFDENLKVFGDRVRKRKGRSDRVLSRLNSDGERFNGVYVDADHSGPAVLRDGILAFSLLVPGGVLIFDDYLWRHPSVSVPPGEAIDAFLRVFRDEVDVIGKSWQVAVRKRAGAR